MKLEQLKRIEDLRPKAEEVLNQKTEEELLKIKRVAHTVKEEFETFFIKNGFTVQSNSNSVTATYGKLTAKIQHEEPYKYMASLLKFNLSLSSPDENEYLILLRRDWKLHLRTDKGLESFSSMCEILEHLFD